MKILLLILRKQRMIMHSLSACQLRVTWCDPSPWLFVFLLKLFRKKQELFSPRLSEISLDILSPPHLSVHPSLTGEDGSQRYSRLQAIQCQKQVMITSSGKKCEELSSWEETRRGKWKMGVSCENLYLGKYAYINGASQFLKPGDGRLGNACMSFEWRRQTMVTWSLECRIRKQLHWSFLREMTTNLFSSLLNSLLIQKWAKTWSVARQMEPG